MKNWKTTLIGLLGAIAIALEPIISGQGFNWKDDGGKIFTAIVVAALGFVAKDHDVTGGTRQQ
jgi:hypothetical protein